MDLCDRKMRVYTGRWRCFFTWNAGRSSDASAFYLWNRCLQTSLVVWCERQEEKGEQIEYSDEETEVQEAGDDLAFLDGEFVENETHDFI